MPEVMSLCKGPKEAWEGMVDKGVELSRKPLLKVFHQAFYAGCYIGFGGFVSTVIAGGLTEVGHENPGIQQLVFAALFPVNLLIIILTGGILYTGVSATVAGAVYEGKVHWIHLPKLLLVSTVGNQLGALVFALLVTFADMNTGLTAGLAAKLTIKKCSKTFLQTFVKGIGCNWMVCVAVFLSTQAQDMAGKMVGIWFPISCFVASGFEHLPANQFTLVLGLLTGESHLTIADVILKNWIPTALGNLFAGSIVVAAGYSYAFGRLGDNIASSVPLSRCSAEEGAWPGQCGFAEAPCTKELPAGTGPRGADGAQGREQSKLPVGHIDAAAMHMRL